MVATLTPAVRVRAVAATRPQGRRVLTALPTLSPGMLAPRLRGSPAPFPLSGANVRRYYFARNAIWQAARLLGLADQEVLVPAYHHGVEVEALEAAGAVPRFVRVDGKMRLDLEHLQRSIGPRTRAIYVIHFLGFPQPMEEIAAIARQRGLPVVEDCALALLSKDGQVPLGARGDVGIFCLYKSLPVPNGGLLSLNRDLDAPAPARSAPIGSTLSHAVGSFLAHLALRHGPGGEAVRESLRRAQRAVRSATGVHPLATGTMHFDPGAADVGMSGLTRLILEGQDYEQIVEARRRNWSLLYARLREVAPPVQLELPPGTCPLFYPLLVDDKVSVAARLAARGIETVEFWNEGHPGCDLGQFPEVATLRRRVLELPLHQDLTAEDMAYLASAVEELS
ncbi:MAG TPA: DegT/DnrJ/EryC1/StrS family aminotransferase [Anaeromyxobacteraceae bacterium]